MRRGLKGHAYLRAVNVVAVWVAVTGKSERLTCGIPPRPRLNVISARRLCRLCCYLPLYLLVLLFGVLSLAPASGLLVAIAFGRHGWI